MSKTNLKSKKMGKVAKTVGTANVGDMFLLVTEEAAMPGTRYPIKKYVLSGHLIMVKAAVNKDMNDFILNEEYEVSKNQRTPKINTPIFDEKDALDFVNELNEASWKEFLEIQREVEDMGKVLKGVKDLYENKTSLDYDKIGRAMSLEVDTTQQ